ncbi:MAG: hypothetical protein IK088_01100 [Lachnospiraceae bacterium]|nr:hypothetical protein [Lachnospiraceae bacterium]
MKEKLKSFFTKNIALKIVSIILGSLIWMALTNYQDPSVTTPVSVPVTYVNQDLLLESERLVMLSGPSQVQVNVVTSASNQMKVSPSMFSCTADLTDHNGGDLNSQRVHINVKQLGGTDIILDWTYQRNDPNISVVMDRYITKTFPVELLPIDSLAEGLILGSSVTFDPESVEVSGPETRFTNLAHVKAPVSLSDLTDGTGGVFTETVGLNLFDANNQAIPNQDNRFVLNQTTATMTAVVSRIKNVALVFLGAEGTAAEGFRYVNGEPEPSVIQVYGLKGTVADLTSITIPKEAVNIDGLTGDADFEIDITKYLPEGVGLADPSKQMVTVHIYVEALVSETFELTEKDVEIENADPDMVYEIEPFKLPVEVTGFREDVDLFKFAEVRPVINAEGLTEEENECGIVFTKSQAYDLQYDETFRVKVTLKPIEEESTGEETEEPSESSSESAE